jgi:hypothetical protein
MPDDERDSDLQRLRTKYLGLSGGQVFDPHFKDIASKTISADGRRKLPYSSTPPIARTPSARRRASMTSMWR